MLLQLADRPSTIDDREMRSKMGRDRQQKRSVLIKGSRRHDKDPHKSFWTGPDNASYEEDTPGYARCEEQWEIDWLRQNGD